MPARRADGHDEVIFRNAGADEVKVTVEIARTDHERNRGLMFREHLADGHGMLFLFERPQHLTFWMHNTLIPLDMIFVATDGQVVGVVENAEPQTDSPRGVAGDSQFVVEVPGGWASAHHITTGTTVHFVESN